LYKARIVNFLWFLEFNTTLENLIYFRRKSDMC
jgi:hypothetical protein